MVPHKHNPFSKGPGAPAGAPQGETAQGLPEPPPGSLCPFFGGVAVPMVDPGAAGMIRRPDFNPLDAIQTGVAFQACQGDRCRMWEVAKAECGLKLAAQAQVAAAQTLAEVKVALEPLAGWFGRRG